MVVRHVAPLVVVALVSTAMAVPMAPSHAQYFNVSNDSRLPPIIGNGQPVTQQRPIGDFRRLVHGGTGQLEVRVGPAASLTVTADSNILPYLTNRIRGDELVLKSNRSFRAKTSPRYVLTVPDLRAINLAGSGNARIEPIANRALELTVAGSGSVRIAGRTGKLNVTVAGSGDVDAVALRAASADVTIAGSGDVRLATDGPINGSIVGSGSVSYAGTPSSVSLSRIGSGRVSRLR